MKSFETWMTQDLKNVFGLVRNDKIPALEKWLEADYQPSDEHKNQILAWQQRIYTRIEMLSEADIKVYLIHHLIELVNFWAESYRGFYEYSLIARKKDIQGKEIALNP